MKKALKAFDFQAFFCGAFIAKPYGGSLPNPCPNQNEMQKKQQNYFSS
jgi:hypothetical protein